MPVLENFPLAARTTWRMGGAARWLVQPRDGADLEALFASWPVGLPRLVLGGGSNLLVNDAGFEGVVIDMTSGFDHLRLEPMAGVIEAGAGASSRALAHFARRHGLSGAEFLCGIPGTIGGALRMNAGSFAVGGYPHAAQILDGRGGCRWVDAEALGLAYRFCALSAETPFPRRPLSFAALAVVLAHALQNFRGPAANESGRRESSVSADRCKSDRQADARHQPTAPPRPSRIWAAMRISLISRPKDPAFMRRASPERNFAWHPRNHRRGSAHECGILWP